MRILHLLNWKIEDIRLELQNISSQGFDAIQINPVQPLKEEGFKHWWLSYQPCGFTIGNQYGTKEELRQLTKEAKSLGLDIFVDVICNHVANEKEDEIKPHSKVCKRLTSNKEFFKEEKNIHNWEDRYEVINYGFGNLPALQVNNEKLQDIIIDFLNELLDLGVSGFRFDAAKNIGLPHEGVNFWPRVLYCLNKMDVYIYGEIIFANEDILNHYAKFMKLLTNSHFHNNDAKVSFVETHDSYYEFGYTKDKSEKQINNEYYHLVDHFSNTIYFARPNSYGFKDEKVKHANTKHNKVYKYRR